MRAAVLRSAAALLVLASCGAPGRPSPDDEGTAEPARSDGVRAVFLGDSYTVGLGAEESYVAPTAEALGWTAVDLGESGTGYVAPGGTAPYRARLGAVVAAEPDVVLVQGSTNDIGHPAQEIGAAASRVYADLEEALPDARLVVVGPLAPPAVDPSDAATVRDAVREAADDADVPFIDPISEDWLTPPDGLFADELHPNDVGYRRLAAALVAALRAEGF